MTEHPSDADLREFVGHSLASDRLMALDDHLASCEVCRGRAADLGNAAAQLMALRTDVLLLEEHLSDEEFEHLAAGSLTSHNRSRVETHLGHCAACAREAADLRRWVATRARRPTLRYVAAAAAVILLVLVPLAISRWSTGEQLGGQLGLAGLESLPSEQAARVSAALTAGAAEPPEWIAEAHRSETLMGVPAGANRFQLTAPVQTATLSDRPEFRWTALPGAVAYTVVILDANLTPAAGPAKITGTAWTPPQPLARGVVYVWQVTAHRGTDSVTVPAPPAQMVRFSVLDQRTTDVIERVMRTEPRSRVLLGILLAQAGVVAEAEAQLREVPPTDPHAGVALGTLERLQNIRQSREQGD